MDAQKKLESILNQLNTVIVGKPEQTQDCVACLLAGGHLLIEDVPGVGKTTLALALAKSFVFPPGPLFAQVLLADEINRASPKTQSALFEAMEEKQVTVDGDTRPLP